MAIAGRPGSGADPLLNGRSLEEAQALAQETPQDRPKGPPSRREGAGPSNIGQRSSRQESPEGQARHCRFPYYRG